MLANKVKERRMALGMTQDQLAARAGTTRQTIIKIEQGRAPSGRVMLSIADALKARPDELFLMPGSNVEITSGV